MLDRLLYDDVRRRTGASLDDRQKQRLVKTVKHYMGEVYRVNSTQSIQFLNKETLTAVIPDYMSYLRRETESKTSTQSDVEVVTSTDPLRTDVGSRFALMQEARKDQKEQPPPPPDFRVPLDEEQPAALDLFEQVKRLRQAEAERDAKNLETQKLKQSTELVGTLRPIEAAAVIRQKTLESELPTPSMPPDMRSVLFGTNIARTYDQSRSGLAEANPTIAVPQLVGRKPILPQDFIQREDDVMNYKENEFNLFCYSADRNWVVNTGENRYNFSVTFNGGNPIGQTFRNQTTTQMKFKNITRIELVKILMPVEGVEVMIDASGSAAVNKTTFNSNLLSFPYLMVYCPELDTNNVGTNFNIDNAFGLVQYDANWISDNAYSPQRGGYVAMIPKFMKCQKVYYPTPLSTLQKLTIRIQRPDGSLLSTVPDSLTVSGFIMSQFLTVPAGNIGTGNFYTGGASGLSRYIWIKTSTWFSRFMFTVGDRIQLENLVFDSTINSAANGNAPGDFLNYIQNPQGLLVVNVGYVVSGTPDVFFSGTNSVGYANYIIVDARFNDPTTGVTTVSPFGGNTTVANSFSSAISNVADKVATGGVINLSHQTQVVFRVITRDMDAASRLRPDNLN